MEAFLIILLLLLVGPLSHYFGADSRVFDERDGRGWWPGSPR
jgi:hypothetical protein